MALGVLRRQPRVQGEACQHTIIELLATITLLPDWKRYVCTLITLHVVSLLQHGLWHAYLACCSGHYRCLHSIVTAHLIHSC